MVKKPNVQDVSGFSQDWLSLREPADHVARNPALNEALIDWASRKTPLRIMDFGTGTGSNLRYLCPLLGHEQHWTLVDNDEKLLSHLPDILSQWAESNGISAKRSNDMIILANETFSASVQWQQTDLANDLRKLPFAATDLVTGSALLDLTSAGWIDQLATQCIEHRCASLFVLNYDGRMEWQPRIDEDELMRQQLNQHQLNDKGFGNALGPQAGHYFAEQLLPHHQVTVMSSDWVLNRAYHDLQSALIEGWTGAAIEHSAGEQASIEQWRIIRESHNARNQSNLSVGHTDVLALPTGAV